MVPEHSGGSDDRDPHSSAVPPYPMCTLST
jgi:hypothetical protein